VEDLGVCIKTTLDPKSKPTSWGEEKNSRKRREIGGEEGIGTRNGKNSLKKVHNKSETF